MRILSLTLLVLGASLAASALAQDKGTFEEYVKGLKEEARQQGISSQVLTEAFHNVEYTPRAVNADRNQPEQKLTLDQYVSRTVPDSKIKQANEVYKKYAIELKRIGEKYNVQPSFIVALWGIESNFGLITGNYRVIDALSTLAYEGRREAFFRKEALAALTILQQGDIAPEDMKGSWAGTMGQCQFMPTTFLDYAADGNGDGKKDIWGSKADVFASIANYLTKLGWDGNNTWGRPVQVPQGLSPDLQGVSLKKVSISKSGPSLVSLFLMADLYLS